MPATFYILCYLNLKSEPHKRHYVKRFQVLAKSNRSPDRFGSGLTANPQVKPFPAVPANTSRPLLATARPTHKMLIQALGVWCLQAPCSGHGGDDAPNFFACGLLGKT